MDPDSVFGLSFPFLSSRRYGADARAHSRDRRSAGRAPRAAALWAGRSPDGRHRLSQLVLTSAVLFCSNSDDNMLKNIELFDKLSLRFNGRVLFIKDVIGDEICCWSFYGQGRKIAEVCCTSIVYATEKKQTKVSAHLMGSAALLSEQGKPKRGGCRVRETLGEQGGPCSQLSGQSGQTQVCSHTCVPSCQGQSSPSGILDLQAGSAGGRRAGKWRACGLHCGQRRSWAA